MPKTHIDTDNSVGAAPRPWRMEVKRRDDGEPRSVTVTGADDSVVEFRTSGGHTTESFARVIANIRLYVEAVNIYDDTRAMRTMSKSAPKKSFQGFDK